MDILEEIDIKNWKPSSTQENQYFAVKINNDDKNYLLKIVNANFKYEFKKNMEDYDVEYGKLMKMKNILAPIYLFKDDENCICGYLFETKDYVNLNNYLNATSFLFTKKGLDGQTDRTEANKNENGIPYWEEPSIYESTAQLDMMDRFPDTRS